MPGTGRYYQKKYGEVLIANAVLEEQVEALRKENFYLKEQVKRHMDQSQSQAQAYENRKGIPQKHQDRSEEWIPDKGQEEEISGLLDGLDFQEPNTSARASYSKEYGRIHKYAAQDAAGREDAEISRLCMSLNELQKKILHVIGTEGLSKSVHIIARVMKEGKWSDSTCRRAEVSLVRMGILKSVVCRGVPHMLKVQLYHMTKKGKTIFEGMYGKKPVESEMETLIREHGSLCNGYSVRETALLFESSEYIKNRKGAVKYLSGRKQLPAGKGEKGRKLYFVPSIIINFPDGTVRYFEYETASTQENSFQSKCRKYSRAAKRMYFVAPNRVSLEKTLKWIENWLKKTWEMGGAWNSITVYVQTFQKLEYQLSSIDRKGRKKKSEPEWVQIQINPWKEGAEIWKTENGIRSCIWSGKTEQLRLNAPDVSDASQSGNP